MYSCDTRTDLQLHFVSELFISHALLIAAVDLEGHYIQSEKILHILNCELTCWTGNRCILLKHKVAELTECRKRV
jgi:hypothetical protein